jgi:hypothetical protein
MLRGYGATSQLGEALDQAITAYPRYMPLHQIVLSTLQPKWGRHRYDVRLDAAVLNCHAAVGRRAMLADKSRLV